MKKGVQVGKYDAVGYGSDGPDGTIRQDAVISGNMDKGTWQNGERHITINYYIASNFKGISRPGCVDCDAPFKLEGLGKKRGCRQ